MSILHRDCGGKLYEDTDSPLYSLGDDCQILTLRCSKCGEEIVGDPQIKFDECLADTEELIYSRRETNQEGGLNDRTWRTRRSL